jgi:signal transduction histidine kinase
LVTAIFEQLHREIESHPAANGKHLRFDAVDSSLVVRTDLVMLLRVLENMVVNALEATPTGGEVRVYAEQVNGGLRLCVWSREEIPPDIARRVFQRNFSTKQQSGRGLGTFSMKLFGEQLLGGKVDFVTSGQGGTIFRIVLPEPPTS